MSAGEYAVDVALVAFAGAGFAALAVALRARLLPAWGGAPARLVEAVLLVALLVAAAQVLGVARLLETIPLLVLAALVAVAAVRVGRGSARSGDRTAAAAALPGSTSAVATAVAVAAAAVVAGDWAARTATALAHGMPNVDTLWYHGPVAARFAQDGSFAALAQTQPDPLTPFYPANAELLHAVGMVLTGHDGLSPLVNLGWLAVALLAAWCIGRPFGVAGLTLLGGAVVLGSPLMTVTQAGDATNDVAGLALFLATVALVLTARGDRAVLALAAVPAGIALGTKVSLIAPVAALLVALIVAARGARTRLALTWLALLTAFGGLWYARNLLLAGNPIPAVDLPLLRAASADPALQAPATGFDTTLIHLLGQSGAAGIVSGGFEADFGPLWPALLAAAAAALAGALAFGRDRTIRALGAAGIAVVVAWAFTPQSGTSFTVNVRHVVPALALGLALLPILLSTRAPVARHAVLAALALIFAGVQLGDAREPVHTAAWVLGAGATAALVAAAALAPRPRAAVFAAAALTAIVALFFVERDFLRDRYADPASPVVTGPEDGRLLAEAFAWARGVRGATIGLSGTQLQYPLMGLHLDNRVRYLHASEDDGRVVAALPTCEAWRRAVARLKPDFVVVTPVRFPLALPTAGEPREAGWTRSLEGAEQIAAHGGRVFVFRMHGSPSTGC